MRTSFLICAVIGYAIGKAIRRDEFARGRRISGQNQ
jgi:hypothetical protein